MKNRYQRTVVAEVYVVIKTIEDDDGALRVLDNIFRSKDDAVEYSGSIDGCSVEPVMIDIKTHYNLDT